MNHQNDFNKSTVHVLAQTLHQAWQKMTKIHTETSNSEQTIQEAEDAVQIIEAIKSWSETKEAKTECTQYLAYLLNVKQDLVRTSMNIQAWSDLYLSKSPVQKYLKSVMGSVKQECSSTETEYIMLLMRQLVKPSDAQILKELKEVSEWLYHTDKAEAVVALECMDIATLEMIIESNLDRIILAKAKSSSLYEELPDAKIQATATVAKAVNYMRKGFREAKPNYEELFLVTLLFPCQYDVTDRIFRRYLSTSDLEYLKKELKVRSREFGDESLINNVQAYLFNLTIKMYNRQDVDVSEAQVKCHLEYLQDELKGNIDSEVELVLFQLRSSWRDLEFQLDSLEKGISLRKKKEDNVLLDILTTTKRPPQCESTQISNPLQTVAEIPSGNAKELFKKLGLLEYYQKKLTLQDAVIVRQETLEDEQCTKLEMLPYFILQKLMMHDYQCREVIFQESTISSSSIPSQQHDDFDEFDDFNDNPPNVLLSQSSVALSTVHPMDGLLALIHSSDSFLRQELLTKLSTCQLAIPFLLPDPFIHTLSLSLWAMRRIIKEWRCTNPTTGRSEPEGGSPTVSYQTPIVSFCRLTSHRSEFSKSRLLNEVISDSPHNYFFHFHCDGGSRESLLTDGVVELCWYLPSGKPKYDPFAQVITFTNLRGDAASHPKQTKFLSQVSFMNFVLLTEDDLNEKGIQILKGLANTPGGVVLMFPDKKFTPQHEGMKALMRSIPKDKCFRMKLSGKSAADIKISVREQINKKLSHSQQGFRTIEDCAEVARANGIDVDEDVPECVQGREMANKIQEALHKLQASDKDTVLPLQGQKLWYKWAEHDKELHRHVNMGNKKLDQYNLEKEDDKLKIRTQQLSKAESPSPVMESFLSDLLEHDGSVRDYFLQWVKFILDNHSRQKLPELFHQYQNVRMQLLKLQREYKSDNEELKQPLRDQLKVLNDKLVHVSFGLEHLLRELGQMYEATVQQKSVSLKLKENVNRLPQVAAELLVSGYPLELMDGDASHVPLCWVMAVLDQLCKQLNDARLFVISVLGIQSTGKSTLLNTMFGLRFTVSAGRCTRGAFIQLLPLNESLKMQSKCDYLLIIDTEGLRAPELSSQETQKHDNELATFVIGLANVTVINIFGETAGDMDDILQRAVHAFIRMEHVGLKPSCHFVHQNVGAVSGASKGMMGRVNFQEKLNTMTRAAAEEEGLGRHYTMFSHVIDFNEENDVQYFPGLWKGDPPMAPVNPGYSDGANHLKSALIGKIKGASHCRVSAFQTRIQDLWKAILHENFIFSFKNTLEITAFNRLDAEFGQWSWEFQEKMSEWLKRAKNRIGNAAIDALGALKTDLKQEISDEGKRIHDGLEIKRKKFFEEGDQRDILAQWQSRYETRLNLVRIEHEADAEYQVSVLISARQALAKADTLKQSKRDELLLRVKALVSSLESGKLNDRQLDELYEQTWTDWMTELKSRQQVDPKGEVDIELSLESCLKQKFHAQYNLLNPKLSKAPLRTRTEKILKLEVVPGTHITANRVWGIRDGKIFKGESNIRAVLLPAHTSAAEKETREFLKRAEQYLETKRQGKENFNLIFCNELLKIILEAIEESQNKYSEFTFTPEYRVDISLAVCGHAKMVFEQMAKDFKLMNDPVEYLQQKMKEPFRRLFKSQYHQTAQEVTAADNLRDLLVNPIEEAMKVSLAQTIASNVRSSSSSFSSKKALKTRILFDLADKPSFKPYADYLTNVKRSVHEWVQTYTMQYCDETAVESQDGKSRLTVLAELELERLVTLISTAANDVTLQILKEWLVKFHKELLPTHIASAVKEIPDQRNPEEIQKVVEELKKEVASVDIDITKIKYLDQYVKEVEGRVVKYTKQQCKEGKIRLTETELGRLGASISTAASEVTSTFPKALVDEWLYMLHYKLSTELTVDLGDMQKVVGDLKDLKNFTEELCKKLGAVSIQGFPTLLNMETWDKTPYDILTRSLIGCCEQCPFCKEQCELLDSKHEGTKHSISLHRPECLSGRSWKGSNKMALEICTASVGSKCSFGYQDKDGELKWKPYSMYQDVYPTWSISPDVSIEASSYWKWFVATYTTDIAQLYGMKTNEVPQAWTSLTLDKVKDDMKKLYNM